MTGMLKTLIVSTCFAVILPPTSAKGGRRELAVIRDPDEEKPDALPVNEADASGEVGNDPYASLVLLNDVLFNPNVMATKDVDSAEHWMVYFCPTWWEPCRKLLEPFAMQSTEWQSTLNDGLFHKQVRFARVDCASHKPLCNKQGVENYPTVHHYHRGNLVQSWSANGRNDEKRLQKFIDGEVKPLLPASEVLGKSGDLRLIANDMTMLSNDRWIDFAVVLAILGLNFWNVCRSPTLLKKAPHESSAVEPSIIASASDTVPASSAQAVERLMPEDWSLARGESMEL